MYNLILKFDYNFSPSLMICVSNKKKDTKTLGELEMFWFGIFRKFFESKGINYEIIEPINLAQFKVELPENILNFFLQYNHPEYWKARKEIIIKFKDQKEIDNFINHLLNSHSYVKNFKQFYESQNIL